MPSSAGSPAVSSALLSRVQFVGSISLTAAGVAIADGLAPSPRTFLALGLLAVGAVGISRLAADASVRELHRAAWRRWLLAVVGFVPYGLATAPQTDAAAALGSQFGATIGGVALEAIAGALFLTAVTTTVMAALAQYGLHPDAPTPEERILDESFDD